MCVFVHVYAYVCVNNNKENMTLRESQWDMGQVEKEGGAEMVQRQYSCKNFLKSKIFKLNENNVAQHFGEIIKYSNKLKLVLEILSFALGKHKGRVW